ncbi:hypothetical protein D915_003001 [Fasciola hepatica]|uniref:Armadillo repeat protein deleted in velo-cardio-facial syndrome n=1 Tax=Fasciola hepatica TaxID=6192 RepID=A0A4E0RCC5_FASHE|nr:hypothetical protein D915_003001 [Fasciola hepatica]
MGDKPMPYRYHPPLQFQPATPPTKSRCSTNIFGTSEQFIRRPVCPNRTQKDGDTSGNTTVIDCSQPQVRLSWRKQMEKPPVPRNNDSVCKTDLPVTNHTRQRSMPVTMPSFEKTSLIPSSGLLSVDTESVNLSRTSSTGNVKSNTLLGPNGSYNVVIDIKLRGPESISFTNRMTQSFIEDGGQRIQFRDGLIGRQRSTGELSHHLLEDVHHLSLDNRSRTVQDNCRPKNNFLPRNQSSDSNVSHKPSVCLDNTDDSTTPSLDVSSEPIEFEDVTNPDKTSLNCCKPYNPKTPIPNRRRESSALEEQTKVKISWSPTRAERSNSTSMLRTDRYPNWTRPKMVNFSTNPDVPQLIRLLQSPDTDTVANASAYLQHLVYKNPGLKDKTRQCGGIAALVQLLYSDHAQICLNTVGVLRNLTSGDNLEIKDELERVGGIRALAWLIENRQSHLCEAAHRRQSSGSPEGTPTFFSMNETNTDAFRPSLENAAAVLCNLAGVDHLKRSVLHEALLPSLINTVIRPVATVTANQETGWNSSTTRVPYNQLLFRNTVAVVRNVSSMDSAEYREQLRQCPWLLWSLLTVVRASVTQHCMDLKSVEHCACSLRNLSYALHNLSVLDEPSANKPEEPTVKSKSAIPRLRLRGQQSKRASIAEGSPIGQSYQYPSDNPVGLFFNYQTIQVVLDLLQHSSNPCTLEAAAGILQNLTAGNWAPAQLAKQTIRSHHGLPILTELLNAPSPRVILVISNALRNLATEDHCCLLLGKHALERVILTLTKCANNLTEMGNVRRVENPEWQMPNQEYQTNQSARSSVYGGLSDHVSIKLVYSVTSAVLHLCAVLVQRRIEHAKRFTTLGGIEKCREIYLTTKHQSSIRGAGDMDESKEAAGDARARAFQISEQLLHILWNFTELRPIYKLVSNC